MFSTEVNESYSRESSITFSDAVRQCKSKNTNSSNVQNGN